MVRHYRHQPNMYKEIIRFHGQNNRQQDGGDRHKHTRADAVALFCRANENAGAMAEKYGRSHLYIYFMVSVRARALWLENSDNSWPNNLKHM